VADSAAVAERVEDENCNGDMESMEMEMDVISDIASDHPATASDADVPCSQPPVTTATASASASAPVHSLSWFVFYSVEITLLHFYFKMTTGNLTAVMEISGN